MQAIDATLRYEGPITGSADAQTRFLIGVWLQKVWRNPLLFFGRAFDSQQTIYNPNQGLYFATDYPLASGEVVVRDLRGAFSHITSDPDSLGRCVVPVPAAPLPITLPSTVLADLNSQTLSQPILDAFSAAGKSLSASARIVTELVGVRWVVLDPAPGQLNYTIRLEVTSGAAHHLLNRLITKVTAHERRSSGSSILHVYDRPEPELQAVNLDETLDGVQQSFRQCSGQAEFAPQNLDPPADGTGDDTTMCRVAAGARGRPTAASSTVSVRSSTGS